MHGRLMAGHQQQESHGQQFVFAQFVAILLGLDQGARAHRNRAEKGEAARFVPIVTKMLDDDVRRGLETAF